MSTPPQVSDRVRKIQRSVLAMLVISNGINYIDRATLAVANPLIRHDLGLSIADMGYLLSAFLWAYAFAQLPAGALVDRFRPRVLLTAGLALWSAAQVASGLVTSFGPFYVARLFLGAGEAPTSPTSARVTRDWFNPRNRGFAVGIWNAASGLAGAIGVPLLTVLMLAFGWRWMFIIMGLAGLAMAAIWSTLYRNPSEVTLTDDEIDYCTEGDPTRRPPPMTFSEWRTLFKFRTTWGMMIGFFGIIYMSSLYHAWLPGYLEMQRHMSLQHAGIATAIPFTCGIAGSIAGGYSAHWLIRAGYTARTSCKIPAALALVGIAGFITAAAYVHSNTLAIACLSATVFLTPLAGTCSWALSSVAVPANLTASAGAMMNFAGYLGGALAPTVTGLIVQRTGSFVDALVVGAIIALVAAWSFIFIVPGEVPDAPLDALNSSLAE